MYTKEQVLAVVESKGPLIPVTVSKDLGINILMASALLSELSSKKMIFVSALKIGGSPLYYVKSQEAKLQEFADKLNEKDRKAYELLREKKIVLDTDLEPLMRVAIRQIRDFAKPLQVQHNGQMMIFWKWYLEDTGSASEAIKEKLGVAKAPSAKKPSPQVNVQPRTPKPAPQQKLTPAEQPQSDLLDEIRSYFSVNDIEVVETEIVRKKSEINFIVDVPSSVGKLRYFCKAKSKKKINDGDLSSAFIQSRSKNLPCLFLIKGKLTKKAEGMLEEFKGMSVKSI